jgi:hypothetical protein
MRCLAPATPQRCAMILARLGTATLTAGSGGNLWMMVNGSANITVKDEKGDIADIAIAKCANRTVSFRLSIACCSPAPNRRCAGRPAT